MVKLYLRPHDGMRCGLALSMTLFVLVVLTRLDGHKLWVNPAQVNTVEGAGQLGYQQGTLLDVGGHKVTVKENVSEVVRALRGFQEPLVK